MEGWARRRVHVSWLIAALSAGVLIGIVLAAFVPGRIIPAPILLFVAVGLAAATFWQRSLWLVPFIIISGLLFGFVRGSDKQASVALYKPYVGKAVTVSGVVSEDVGTLSSGATSIKLTSVQLDGRPMGGQIWISTRSNMVIKRSDVLTAKGTLKTGFGSFAASISFAAVLRVERPDYSDVARDVRDDFAAAVRKGIKEPEASLGNGFLTGQRSSLPTDLDEELKIVGLTHVVVASGYNLTILVRFARRAFAKVSKYLATAAAGGMIAGFVLVTGWSPSMSRAGLVAGLSLLAWYYGRTVHPVILLLFAAAVTGIMNPFFVWGDIGWYLSFASFAGVIILAPLVHDYFWGSGRPGAIRQIFIDTSCAQLATLPIMAFAFGHYSLYALPANLLVLPLVPLAMILTFFAGIAGLVMPAVAHIIGWPAQELLSYMTHVVHFVANQPGAQGDVAVPAIVLGIGYALMLALGYMLWRRTQHSFRQDSIVE